MESRTDTEQCVVQKFFHRYSPLTVDMKSQWIFQIHIHVAAQQRHSFALISALVLSQMSLEFDHLCSLCVFCGVKHVLKHFVGGVAEQGMIDSAMNHVVFLQSNREVYICKTHVLVCVRLRLWLGLVSNHVIDIHNFNFQVQSEWEGQIFWEPLTYSFYVLSISRV